MKTEIEKLEEKNTVLLKVEVPAEVFGEAINKAYKKISGQLVIPGFRKGKVPKAIIDSRIGKQSVQQEALQSALPNYYVDALKESDVEPIDQPEIDIVQLEENKPLLFTAKVRVRPEVKLGKYEGLKVEKPPVEPTEEEIEGQIEKIRNDFASLEPVEGRPVKEGDFALINFEGFVDDEPFEGGSANDYLLEVGSRTFIPGFEEQIVGMKKGDLKDIMVTFPEDYGSEQLAGKEAKFRVLLKEIKEKKLQELNDDFAKQVGFETLEELKEDIKGKIYDAKKKFSDAEVRSQAVDQATESAEVELHDVMVEQELDEMIEELETDVRRQGLTLDKYLELTGMNIEDLRNDWHDKAENRVKSRLVLEAVAKAENIEVTPEEVDNEIRKVAEATGRDFEEVKRIFEIKNTRGALRNRILISKTIDWLVDHATVEEVKEDEKEKAEIKTAKETAGEETKDKEEN